MQIQDIGRSDGNYDTVPSTMGEDILCLSTEISDKEQIRDGVFVSTTKFSNERMMHYRVVKVGKNVTGEIGVREGDWVYVDMLGRFADTFPISFIHFRSVLFKTDSEGKDVTALKGRVIVNVVEPKEKVNSFGFVQLTDIDPYGEVLSIGEGCTDRGFKVGDRISIQSSDSNQMYLLGNRKLMDYDYRTPAVKFANKEETDAD